MSGNLADRFAGLPHLLAGHLLLSVSALVIGIAISVPLVIAAPIFDGQRRQENIVRVKIAPCPRRYPDASHCHR